MPIDVESDQSFLETAKFKTNNAKPDLIESTPTLSLIPDEDATQMGTTVQLESHIDSISREDEKSVESDLRPESGCSAVDCLSPEPEPESEEMQPTNRLERTDSSWTQSPPNNFEENQTFADSVQTQ